MFKNFIVKNYVFFVGLLSAIALFLEQAVASGPADIKVILTGGLMVVISYVANKWQAGGVTVTGILGSLAYVFVQLYQNGHIDWTQFAVLAAAKIIAALSSGLQAFKPND